MPTFHHTDLLQLLNESTDIQSIPKQAKRKEERKKERKKERKRITAQKINDIPVCPVSTRHNFRADAKTWFYLFLNGCAGSPQHVRSGHMHKVRNCSIYQVHT